MDWAAHVGQRCRIYRNLSNGRMSIQAYNGKSWMVVGHVTDCLIRDVVFHINESGRQRVIKKQKKNVHAWGQGILIGEFDEAFCPVDLAYNPYVNSTFVERGTDNAIRHCQFLRVTENLVFVSPDAISGAPVIRPVKKIPKQIPLFFTLQMQAA
ncbi:MAG: hypothetical protein WCA35_20915 [Kovacikia sp.]